MTCGYVKRKVFLMFFLLIILLAVVLFFKPNICRADNVSVQLVWKFPEPYWLEIEIVQGSYNLNSDRLNLKLTSGDNIKIGRSGLYRFWQQGDQMTIIHKPELIFTAESDGVFRVREPGKEWLSYRGHITVAAQGIGWVLTNTLAREDYLKGVVPVEMSNSWAAQGMEALKAQAVAARTYLLKNMDRNNTITDSPNIHQAYSGKGVEGEASFAVEATAGEILVDRDSGQPIDVFYSSHNGGYSEVTEHVWLNHDPHYLAKPDSFSLGIGGAADSWRFLIAADILGSSFELAAIREVVLKKYPSGRVYEVILVDWLGNQKTVSGGEFVSKFYPYNRNLSEDCFLGKLFEVEFIYPSLPSLQELYSLQLKKTSAGPVLSRLLSSNDGLSDRERYFGIYVFNGRGWGHGVGMSQWGAYNMARLGYSYRDILNYYYHNTTLVKTDK